MRHREPTPVEKLAADAGLLAHHDTQRDLLRLPDEASIEAFIAAADEADIWIDGFEGFEILKDGIRPDLSAVSDFSTCSDAAESRNEARTGLKELAARNLAFEFELRA